MSAIKACQLRERYTMIVADGSVDRKEEKNSQDADELSPSNEFLTTVRNVVKNIPIRAKLWKVTAFCGLPQNHQ
jgi:hypothetical protein